MQNKLKILLMLVGVFFLFQIDVKANEKIDTRLTVRFQLVEQDTSTDEEEQIALAGMEFAVYTKDGKLESILSTNTAGWAILTLNEGTYYLKAKKLTGDYEMVEEQVSFTVKENNQAVNIPITKEQGQIVLNVIRKNSQEGNGPFPGLKFQVINSNNVVVDTIITDQSGVAIAKGLSKGTYKIHSLNDDQGYQEIEDFTVNIKEGEKYETRLVINERIVTIAITDENDKNIPGIMVELYDNNDELIKKFTTTEENIKISKLPKGEYYFILKNVPKQYYYNNEKEYFTLAGDTLYSYRNLKLETAKSNLQVIYKGSDGKLLDNVQVRLYDINNNVILEGKTGQNGMLTVFNLPYGKYYLEQVSALGNYLINSDVYDFEVKDKNTIIEIENQLKNTENVISEEIINPSTSDNIEFYFIVCVVTIVLLSSTLIILRKKI